MPIIIIDVVTIINRVKIINLVNLNWVNYFLLRSIVVLVQEVKKCFLLSMLYFYDFFNFSFGYCYY